MAERPTPYTFSLNEDDTKQVYALQLERINLTQENKDIKDDAAMKEDPKNKKQLRKLVEVGRQFSTLFAKLNGSIEIFQYDYWKDKITQSKHSSVEPSHRDMTALEKQVLSKALELRDVLYGRYDELSGVARSSSIQITKKSLTDLFKELLMPINTQNSKNGLLAPHSYDTVDNKKFDETKDDWTRPYVRRHTGKPLRVRDENNDEIKLPSVKCDV